MVCLNTLRLSTQNPNHLGLHAEFYVSVNHDIQLVKLHLNQSKSNNPNQLPPLGLVRYLSKLHNVKLEANIYHGCLAQPS